MIATHVFDVVCLLYDSSTNLKLFEIALEWVTFCVWKLWIILVSWKLYGRNIITYRINIVQYYTFKFDSHLSASIAYTIIYRPTEYFISFVNVVVVDVSIVVCSCSILLPVQKKKTLSFFSRLFLHIKSHQSIGKFASLR